MKTKITLLLVSQFLNLLFFGQAYEKTHAQSVYEEAKKKYFPTDLARINLMKKNWGMYFKDDVANLLDTAAKNYLFEVKLDSYGCLYPDKNILDVIDQETFHGKIKDYWDGESHSFHRLFKEDKDSKISKQIAVMDGDKKTKYTQLLSLSKDTNDDKFHEEWNNYHHAIFKKELNDLIKKRKISRVVFVIHGYNVPYSLAALQVIKIRELAKNTLKQDTTTTLFIPIYWPSNNAKYSYLEPQNFDTRNIEDRKKNGKLFLIYSTRCYYASITFRRILNDLDPNVFVEVISHSLGATIATSAVINTFGKMDYSTWALYMKRDSCYHWTSGERDYYYKNDGICFDLIKLFNKYDIPKRKINFFLSAAAIPGVATFNDLNSNLMANKQFFVTYNSQDEMLTKNCIRGAVKRKIKLNLPYIKASDLSSTTLGCNFHCETSDTEKLYNKLVGPGLFHYAIVSDETDHDIFTYIQEPEYIEFFGEFLKLGGQEIRTVHSH